MKRTIYPITRIEGHADIELVFDKDGKALKGIRLLIGSFRGFEKILVGRPIEDVPRIVTRICGLCPWAHHLAAIKAIEDALGISVPESVTATRRLALHLAHIQDKILHFFMLSMPDFFSLELKRPVRGLSDVMRTEPELSKRALDAKRLCFECLELLGGKAIHPVSMVIGGHLNPPDKEALKAIKRALTRLLDFSIEAVEKAKERFFYPLKGHLLSMPSFRTGFLGMIAEEKSGLELYDGPLRILSPKGDAVDFHPRDYQEHLIEECVEWSYSKLVKSRDWLDEHSGGLGIYRVNALARLMVSKGPLTPRARKEYEEFKRALGEDIWHPMNYHWARLIEMVFCCEDALDILETQDLASGPNVVSAPVIPAGFDGTRSGIGCLEAPRGTLIHHYEIDPNGFIQKANLIVGTTHNIAPMNEDAKAIAKAYVAEGLEDKEGLRKKIFMAIRAHDP